MEIKSLKISSKNKNAHKKMAQIIRSGGIAVTPTDTVYGLVADAFNMQAQRKIYFLKGRKYKKPLIIMAHNIDSVRMLASISDDAYKIVKRFWPGQLTLILPTNDIGKIISGGRTDIGVRIPNHSFMLKFLKEFGKPVWTTSANISNTKSAKTFEETLIFENKVDVLIDGGKCKCSFESTIIDAVKYPFTVLRKGALDVKKI
ncbi:MAG: threonylcarbamoyl-AMP synthase [Elusimicrobiota bacterium]|jgi:L-threonylcarbamoyladenylate synthase|nr:threonylcarbamoyl-AMP synthase [Elusimicrobiota bacterium]